MSGVLVTCRHCDWERFAPSMTAAERIQREHARKHPEKP